MIIFWYIITPNFNFTYTDMVIFNNFLQKKYRMELKVPDTVIKRSCAVSRVMSFKTVIYLGLKSP